MNYTLVGKHWARAQRNMVLEILFKGKDVTIIGTKKKKKKVTYKTSLAVDKCTVKFMITLGVLCVILTFTHTFNKYSVSDSILTLFKAKKLVYSF